LSYNSKYTCYMPARPPRPPATSARPSARRVEGVADALRDEILAGRPPPGEKLPSEAALADRFGVARVVVREAVARLRAFGLVLVRRGSGAVVCDWRRTGGLELLPALLERSGPLTDPGRALVGELLSLRRTIGAELLVAAARRRTPEGLAAMRGALLRARAALHGRPKPLFPRRLAGLPPTSPATVIDLEALIDADLDFARAVALAAGNLPALLLVNAVIRPLATTPVIAAAVYAEPARNVAGLDAALAAVESGDAENVGLVVRALLEDDDMLALARLEAAAREIHDEAGKPPGAD